jgi:hypothetical protein
MPRAKAAGVWLSSPDPRLHRLYEQFVEQIYARRSPDRGPLCLLRDAVLWRGAPPDAVGIMSAYHDDARLALRQGFCAACGPHAPKRGWVKTWSSRSALR